MLGGEIFDKKVTVARWVDIEKDDKKSVKKTCYFSILEDRAKGTSPSAGLQKIAELVMRGLVPVTSWHTPRFPIYPKFERD